LNESERISEKRTFSTRNQVSSGVSLSLLHSIPHPPHFLVERAAGQEILDGFGTEYEQVGSDWQCTHAADAAQLNIIGLTATPECEPPNVCREVSILADRQEIAQQLLIFFWDPWNIHQAFSEKVLHGLAI
jgi:hypothetical protein